MTATGLAIDLAALNSIPDVRSATAERRRKAAMANAASAAASPRQIPASARPQPAVRQRGGEGLETLRALEHYLSDSVAGIPRGAPERLHAYRYVFTALIGQLPAHGPLLSEVKMEYDAAIESGSKLQPPHAGQRTLHPLQLPSSYYEREMRRAKGELARTREEALALQRVLARTRARAAEARSRTQAAGLPARPEGARAEAGGLGLGRVLGAAEARVAATDKALSLTLAAAAFAPPRSHLPLRRTRSALTMQENREPPHNVLGGDLDCCCANVRGTGIGTGFYRDGFCSTGDDDRGRHTVCIEATADFLRFSAAVGNDLSTPFPQYVPRHVNPGPRMCLQAPPSP